MGISINGIPLVNQNFSINGEVCRGLAINGFIVATTIYYKYWDDTKYWNDDDYWNDTK